jgi:tyrosinase
MQRIATVAAAVILSLASMSQVAQPNCQVRRNVDTVSAADIKALSDAIQLLKSQNPDRYNFWKDVHGRVPEGPCYHDDDQLLPWHRAMLYYFEQELRRVSGNSCLALVYWNWTTNATGKQGYPKEFEDAFPHRRNDNGATPQPAIDPVDIARLLRMSWTDFSDGIQSPHGYIHGGYVGGDMTVPPTAANDVIFYGHHANLDRIFAEWQRTHSGENPPNETFNTAGFPRPTSTNDVLDIRTLKYSYDATAVPLTAALAAAPPRPPAKLSPHGAVTTFPIDIAQLSGDSRLVFQNVPISNDFSQEGVVYLHPANVPYKLGAQFVHDFYAGYFFIWQRNVAEHTGHPAVTNVVVDLGRRLSLWPAKVRTGRWVVTVVTSRVSVQQHGLAEVAAPLPLIYKAAAVKTGKLIVPLKGIAGGVQ